MVDPTEEYFCYCRLDMDGECPRCREEILAGFKRISGAFSELLKGALAAENPEEFVEKSKDKGPEIECYCPPCANKYMDLGISKGIVPELGAFSRDYAHAYLESLLVLSYERGHQKMPLSRKAWETLCQEKGWLPGTLECTPDGTD